MADIYSETGLTPVGPQVEQQPATVKNAGNNTVTTNTGKKPFDDLAAEMGLTEDQKRVADVIHTLESRGGKIDTSSPNKWGARGQMQVIASTFKEMQDRGYISKDARWDNSDDNTKAGLAYVKYLSDMYNGDPEKILAAYNGGPKAVNPDGTLRTDRRPKGLNYTSANYSRDGLKLLSLNPETHSSSDNTQPTVTNASFQGGNVSPQTVTQQGGDTSQPTDIYAATGLTRVGPEIDAQSQSPSENQITPEQKAINDRETERLSKLTPIAQGAEGAMASLKDMWNGAQQLLTHLTGDEKRRAELQLEQVKTNAQNQMLNASTSGKIGSYVPDVALAIGSIFLPILGVSRVAAASPILATALELGAQGAIAGGISSLRPNEQGVTTPGQVGEGALVGGATGAVLGGVGRTLGKVFGKGENALTTAESDAARTIGVRPSVAETTGSPFARAVEATVGNPRADETAAKIAGNTFTADVAAKDIRGALGIAENKPLAQGIEELKLKNAQQFEKAAVDTRGNPIILTKDAALTNDLNQIFQKAKNISLSDESFANRIASDFLSDDTITASQYLGKRMAISNKAFRSTEGAAGKGAILDDIKTAMDDWYGRQAGAVKAGELKAARESFHATKTLSDSVDRNGIVDVKKLVSLREGKGYDKNLSPSMRATVDDIVKRTDRNNTLMSALEKKLGGKTSEGVRTSQAIARTGLGALGLHGLGVPFGYAAGPLIAPAIGHIGQLGIKAASPVFRTLGRGIQASRVAAVPLMTHGLFGAPANN